MMSPLLRDALTNAFPGSISDPAMQSMARGELQMAIEAIDMGDINMISPVLKDELNN